MSSVLGQPGGEAAVAVLHATWRIRGQRGDGGVERVEQSSGPCVEPVERIARGDDQLKAAADHVVESPFTTGASDHALNAERAGEGIDPAVGAAAQQSARQRRELERRRRTGGPQQRVALRSGRRIELTEDFSRAPGMIRGDF
jgi:hypothetical protein